MAVGRLRAIVPFDHSGTVAVFGAQFADGLKEVHIVRMQAEQGHRQDVAAGLHGGAHALVALRVSISSGRKGAKRLEQR